MTSQSDNTPTQDDLCRAASDGDTASVARMICNCGINVDGRDTSTDQYAALHYAAESGKVDVVSTLLSNKADPNLRSGELVHDGDNPSDWYWEPGHTPLMLAARWGHLEVVRHLVASDADVSLSDTTSWTALHAACVGDHHVIVELLLSHGAKQSEFSYHRHFDEQLGWYFSGTPLQVAAASGSVKSAILLLDHGASVNESWEGDRRTPIVYAAARGHVGMIELLVQYGSDINAREHRHGHGLFSDMTPLHYAADNGHAAAVKTLLSMGAEPRARESNAGCTPLELARSRGHSDVVSILEQCN